MVDQAQVADERDKLSKAQLELVLRRAAELDKGAAEIADEGVSPEELERIGTEAGLSKEAVQRALAEVRSGALVPVEPPQPPTVLDKTIGPARVIVERVVPGPLDLVQRRVERFLKDQLLEVKRNHGDRMIWRRAEGFWPGVMRAFDFGHQYALSQGIEVESIVTAAGDNVRIRLTIDAMPLRRSRAAGAVGGVAAGAAIAMGGFVFAAGHLPLELILAGAGGTAALGSMFGVRVQYRKDLERMRDLVERFLDDVEHARNR